MKLEFDSIEEALEFAARLGGTEAPAKRTRRTKSEMAAEGQPNTGVPDPVLPSGFDGGTPQTTAAPGPNGSFPGVGTVSVFPGVTAGPVVDPVVAGLVQRIVTRLDSPELRGQDPTQMLAWFRQQTGEANATMDQIKQVALAKLSAQKLEEIAKLMNA